ncbi:MAG TPA: M67 family metallopeptidase [Pyrinomonadaceae bacterium]|nr:M67 family metallopeptidase [Pyrinomonadaceae bacterium]
MLKFTRHHLNALINHAKETAPNECCGLVGAKAGLTRSIYKLTNSAAHPLVSYEAEPEDLFAAQREMRERDETLAAIYHSHPRSAEPFPSETDVRLAYYPDATYLIVGLADSQPIVRAFTISEKEHVWQEVEYEILDE